MCVNNFPRVARGTERPGLEPATSRLQVRRPNHYASTPLKINLLLKFYITFVAFRALLDNYESDTRRPETVTAEEERENSYFLDVVMETPVMQTTHEFLVSQDRAPADVSEFKQLLYSVWFKLYKRLRGDRSVHGHFY